MLHPFPDDIDFYGKDISKATTGQDNIFRFHRNAAGDVCRVTSLSKEEAKEYRSEHGTTEAPIRKRKSRKEKVK